MHKIIALSKNYPVFLFGIIKWHISRYILGRDFPLIATFQLTNRCNFNCRMCNIKNNPRQDTLALPLFKKIIDELYSMGTIYATLSGGEPLLIKDILDYLAYAKSKICSVNLVTNGYLVSEEFAKRLEEIELDSISISLDALGENNDSIRGMPGAFAKTLQGIKLLQKYSPGVKITVNTVISRQNLDELKELADLTERMGVLHKFQPVYKHPDFDGPHKDNRDLSIRSAGDIEKLRSAIAYLKKKRNVSNSRYFLSCIPDYFLSDYRRDVFNQDCIYPSFACEFREDGRLYPCIVGKGWEGGYPVEKGIKEIFWSRQYRREARSLRKCRLCRENFSVCYLESRISLPLANFIKFNLCSAEK